MTDRTPTSDPVAAQAHEPEPLSAKDEAGLRSVINQSMRNDYRYSARTVRMLLDTLDRDREAIRQQARAAFAAQVSVLPMPGWQDRPSYVHGWKTAIVAVCALAASHEPASPEAPGSGLREALLRIYDLSMADGISARLDIREVAGAVLAARPDGAEADAGTTTHCPLEGVHEHAFRGPHRFHEWEPGT